jgi:two-component system, chemotaxis family, sensor kinase CheA
VLETTRLHQGQIQTIAQKEVIRLRNSVLPLLRLNTVFGMETENKSNDDWIFIVVARADDKLVGLAVDSLIGKQEIVIKPLGECLGDVRGIAGASILGDGQVALILDIPTLVKSQIAEASRGKTAELARL